MPSVCIQVRKTYTESEEIAIMNAVQAALVTAFGVGADVTVRRAHESMRTMNYQNDIFVDATVEVISEGTGSSLPRKIKVDQIRSPQFAQ